MYIVCSIFTQVREIISRRQTQSAMEHEMDNWVKVLNVFLSLYLPAPCFSLLHFVKFVILKLLQKRQELSHKADELTQQRDTLTKSYNTVSNKCYTIMFE